MKAAVRRGRDLLTFFRGFVRHPRATGAVAPSSAALAREMLRGAGVGRGSAVLEFGPGTGSFTREILRALGPEGRLLALETNPAFVRLLRERYPRGEFARIDARSARDEVARRGLGPVDAVISGLPFANFDARTQAEILDAARAVLRPDGAFATFQYHHSWLLPRARRFRALLAQIFPGYRTRAVLWNFPPALVLKGAKRDGSC